MDGAVARVTGRRAGFSLFVTCAAKVETCAAGVCDSLSVVRHCSLRMAGRVSPPAIGYRADQQHLIQSAKMPEERFVASLFTPLIGWGIDAFTQRTNYYLFSVYTTKLDTAGGVKAVGILGHFFVVEKPQAFPPMPRSQAHSV